MIRARESMDAWAQFAHRLLDRAQRGAEIDPEHIDWALAYLGDKSGSTKLPESLWGRKPVAA